MRLLVWGSVGMTLPDLQTSHAYLHSHVSSFSSLVLVSYRQPAGSSLQHLLVGTQWKHTPPRVPLEEEALDYGGGQLAFLA